VYLILVPGMFMRGLDFAHQSTRRSLSRHDRCVMMYVMACDGWAQKMAGAAAQRLSY
jgi:hypothetical protein